MVTKYAQGRTFEYKVRDYLIEHGYFVIRSAGSKGSVDLVAFKDRQVLFVQVKRHGVLAPHEWNILYHLASGLGTIPILAQESVRGMPIQLFELINTKSGRGERQPMKEFTLSL